MAALADSIINSTGEGTPSVLLSPVSQVLSTLVGTREALNKRLLYSVVLCHVALHFELHFVLHCTVKRQYMSG